MNRRTISIFILICAASAALSSAQIKQISQDQFYAAGFSARKLLGERPSRQTTKTDLLDGAAIVKSVTRLEEHLPPDRWREVVTEKAGGKEARAESVRVGFMEYNRKNNEPWTAVDLRGGGHGDGVGMASYSCAQFTEETAFADGGAVRKLREYKIDRAGREGLTFSDMIVWLDRNSGAFLKMEIVTGLLEPRVVKSQTVTTYEYDANLKIEAPVKVAAAKH